MTPLRTAILSAIGPMSARTASEIAAELGEPETEVQRELLGMERGGQLTAVVGFYRHNHATKAKQ